MPNKTIKEVRAEAHAALKVAANEMWYANRSLTAYIDAVNAGKVTYNSEKHSDLQVAANSAKRIALNLLENWAALNVSPRERRKHEARSGS